MPCAPALAGAICGLSGFLLQQRAVEIHVGINHMFGGKHLLKAATRICAIARCRFITVLQFIHRFDQRRAVIRRDHATIDLILVDKRGSGANFTRDQRPGEPRSFQ